MPYYLEFVSLQIKEMERKETIATVKSNTLSQNEVSYQNRVWLSLPLMEKSNRAFGIELKGYGAPKRANAESIFTYHAYSSSIITKHLDQYCFVSIYGKSCVSS